jgi:hypothetical protein
MHLDPIRRWPREFAASHFAATDARLERDVAEAGCALALAARGPTLVNSN